MAAEDVKIKIKITGDSYAVDTSLKKTQKELDKVTGKTKKATKATSNFGSSIKGMINPATLAAAALAAVGASVAISVRKFAEFENELLGVKTLLNESSFGAKGLEAGFADMTREVIELNRTVPVALSSMNKALFDTVSAGVDAGKAVKFVGVSSKLAVAGLTSVSIATDGMTSALGAYGFNADEADVVASKFFAAQKEGKTTIEELAGGFGLVGSSASAMGVSFNELLASVSAVTLAGVKTRAAYTGLKAILSNISKPTEDATKEAERLGISFDQTALRTLKLEGFLKQITSSSKFTKESLTKLFGSTEAVNVAFALTANCGAKFSKILKSLGDDTQTAATLTKAYDTWQTI